VSVIKDSTANASALPITASGDVVVVPNDNNLIIVGNQNIDFAGEQKSTVATTAKVIIQEDFSFETVSMIYFFISFILLFKYF
jgi:hypothetical protein